MMDHIIFSLCGEYPFNPTEDINIRASYSSGFRAPQAFDEDMHISAVGGEVGYDTNVTKDLSEEKSRSLSASVRFLPSF